jgi:cytoskeletal protein CcmA (bactofilin family)
MTMWGRKEDEVRTPAATKDYSPAATTEPAPTREATPAAAPRTGEQRRAIIGPSIQVKGELIGSEDLIVEGKIEGVIRLHDHHLTIGRSAQVQATLEAKTIRVEGVVQGDVQAGERVELSAGSTVLGDISAPRIIIADGAKFKGSVDMDHGARAAASEKGRQVYAVPAAGAESATRTPATNS